MQIKNQIAEFRKEQKLSQEALAEKINVSRQAVTKWESGEATPELEKLIALADLFDISLDKLVGREETYYDSIKALIGRMAENGVKGFDGDISPIINRYMNYMQSMGMPAKTILDGLLMVMLTAVVPLARQSLEDGTPSL